jgi:hypothetical protein
MATTPVTPTITVRALNPQTWEPLQGNGQNNFLTDGAAVAQIIAQRLKMFQGDWWEDLGDGLPMFQQILGGSGTQRDIELVTQLIASRITGTVFVTSINTVTVWFQSRKLYFSASVETQFGTVQVTNSPASAAALIQQ